MQVIALESVLTIISILGGLVIHYIAIIKSINKINVRVARIETEQDVIHKIIDRDMTNITNDLRAVMIKCKYNTKQIDDLDNNATM